MKWLLAICIFVLSGCYVTTVRWPNPYLLPRKIRGQSTIGKKVGPLQVNDRNFPVSEGRVYLKNGNQLTGNTWIRSYITYSRGHNISHRPLIEQVTIPWSAIDRRNIHDPEIYREMRTTQVDSVSMQLPLPYHLGDTTTYISYHNEVFLRRDLRTGPIAIYDLSEIDNHELSNYTDRITMPRLILLTNGVDTIRIYKGEWVREAGIKRKMIKFIHRRYQLDKHVTDFKDAGAILQFIANEENKRITSGKSQ
ncbi:hypothetical protein [Chitinophaga sp.]|uniref:hypothetical protein n=1 Tax=Chitinophaga sp. TaxID=1869181 RepID=UPI0031DFE65D